MNIFFQDPNAQKRRAKNVQNGRKSAQKSANGRKSKKTLPLTRKRLLTHFYLYLSEHPDTVPYAEKSAKPRLVKTCVFKNEHFFLHERKSAF